MMQSQQIKPLFNLQIIFSLSLITAKYQYKMIQIEAYFNNIQETLLKELDTAKRSIYVAVAWFTDTHLFEKLINKLNEGVEVSVVIVKDDINDNGQNDFERITQNGGQFSAIEDTLMHNKFCVIDERIVVTGSYNWTYEAATKNLENITVTYNDYDLALKFIQQFRHITGQQSQKQIDNNRIVKRLNVVKNLILLEDDEFLGAQMSKLKAEVDITIITEIAAAIQQRHFSDAVDLIETFITQNSRVTVYEDPKIAALRLEIKDLENRILAIDNTIAEKEKILRDYTLQFNEYLGALIEEIYRLKKEYASRNRYKQKSQHSESEYQQAKQEYEEYTQQREQLSTEETHKLTEAEQRQLKKLYKQAALHCHPDRATEDKQAEAEETFKALQDAYQRQDLAEVERIFNNVKNGIFIKADTTDQTLEQLQQQVTMLRQKLQRKTEQLQTIENNESYQTAINTADWTAYFEILKTDLTDEKAFWEAKLTD